MAWTRNVTNESGVSVDIIGVADNSITNAKLRDSAALSVIGRSANSTGDSKKVSAPVRLR